MALLLALAGPAAAQVAWPGERAEPSREVLFSFRLAEGVAGQQAGRRVSGRVQAWSFEGFELVEKDAPASSWFTWDDAGVDRAYELIRSLISREDADQYLRLGVLMLRLNDRAKAEAAFRVAAKLKPEHEAIGDAALALFDGGGDPVAALAEKTDQSEAPAAPDATTEQPGVSGPQPGGPTSTTRPDTAGAESGSRPWPVPTDEQRARAVERLKLAAAEMLDDARLRATLLETEHFLFYSNLGSGEAQKWAGELDRMYATLLATLEIPAGSKLFYGKAVVFVFRDREEFLVFEQAAFNVDARAAGGICHQRGNDVFICFFKGDNDQRFNSVLIHETVHGFMYRYRSPERLPTWANEGLSDYVAGYLVQQSNEPAEAWRHAKNFVNQNKNPLDIMQQTYEAGTWFTEDSYPVSHMLVRYMLKYRPREFKLWIDDIKDGKDWQTAMKDRFGVTPETLAQGFILDMKAEGAYKRLNN